MQAAAVVVAKVSQYNGHFSLDRNKRPSVLEGFCFHKVISQFFTGGLGVLVEPAAEVAEAAVPHTCFRNSPVWHSILSS